MIDNCLDVIFDGIDALNLASEDGDEIIPPPVNRHAIGAFVFNFGLRGTHWRHWP